MPVIFMVFLASLARARGCATAVAPASPKNVRRFMRFSSIPLFQLVLARLRGSEDETRGKLDCAWDVARWQTGGAPKPDISRQYGALGSRLSFLALLDE